MIVSTKALDNDVSSMYANGVPTPELVAKNKEDNTSKTNERECKNNDCPYQDIRNLITERKRHE